MTTLTDRPDGDTREMPPSERLANPHPGAILLHDYVEPYRMTTYRLAKGLGLAQTHVRQILRGERSITAATALRLGRFFNTSAELWLGMQMDYDLREAQEKLAADLEEIRPYEHRGPVYLDGEPVEWSPPELPGE